MDAAASKQSAQTNRKFRTRQATEQRLLAAATAVFAQRGYAAATIAEMVERSDLSRGAFYIHFDNKRKVFFTLVEQAVAELYDIAPPLPDGSYRDRVRASTRAYYLAFARHKGILRCLFETSAIDAEIGALHNRCRAAFVKRIAGHLQLNIDRGRFVEMDARAVSYCLGALISGVAHHWMCADFDPWPDDAITENRIVDTVTDIWCRTLFSNPLDSLQPASGGHRAGVVTTAEQ